MNPIDMRECMEGVLKQEAIDNENYQRGLELAQSVNSAEEFASRFDSEGYVGGGFGIPWNDSLEGARAAVESGVTVLTEEDITRVKKSHEFPICYYKDSN